MCTLALFFLPLQFVFFVLTVLLPLFQEVEDQVISPEKVEEAKLKARYPHLGSRPGGSDLLRKRLQKGVSHLQNFHSAFTVLLRRNVNRPLVTFTAVVELTSQLLILLWLLVVFCYYYLMI